MTRNEQLDQYVLLDTWVGVVQTLAESLRACGHEEHFLVDEVRLAGAFDLVTELEHELWSDDVLDEQVGPGFDQQAHAEYQGAMTRTIAAEAALLARLTTTELQDVLRSESARLSLLAADRIGKAGGAGA